MVFHRLFVSRGGCAVKSFLHPQQQQHGPPVRWFRRERCQDEEQQQQHRSGPCGCGDHSRADSGRRFDFAHCQWKQRLTGALQWGALLSLGWTLVHPKWWECRWTDALKQKRLTHCCPVTLCQDHALSRAAVVLSALPVENSASTLPSHEVKRLNQQLSRDEGIDVSVPSSEDCDVAGKEERKEEHLTRQWDLIHNRFIQEEKSEEAKSTEEKTAEDVKEATVSPLDKATNDLNQAHEMLLARMESNSGLELLTSGEQPQEGLRLMTSAASRGDAEAMHNLGVAYEHGVGVEQDLTKAVKWFRRAAKKHNVAAMLTLAALQRQGMGGLVADSALADMLVASARALEAEIVEDECVHCKASDSGKGPEPIPREVKPSPQGLYELARQREHGLSGLVKDEGFALELYRKAMRQGHSEAKTAFRQLRAKLSGERKDSMKRTDTLTRLSSNDSGVDGGHHQWEEEESKVALRM